MIITYSYLDQYKQIGAFEPVEYFGQTEIVMYYVRRINIENQKPTYRLTTDQQKPTVRLTTEQPKPTFRLTQEMQ